jgi:hypothetical protein
VCGILEEIDWMSVFKDCAEVVRVKIKCRDPTRIPAGRLFHFQGKFHQLLFEAEGEPAMGVAEDPPPPPPPPSDGNDENGNDGQASERQDGMDTDRSAAAGNASVGSTVVTPGASSSGTVVRRLDNGDEEIKEYASGSEVYDLLLRNGCVGEDGRFIWKNETTMADESVREEIQNFLLDDQENLACHQKIALEGVEMDIGGPEVALLDEILPSFDKFDKEEEGNPDNQGEQGRRKFGVLCKQQGRALEWTEP